MCAGYPTTRIYDVELVRQHLVTDASLDKARYFDHESGSLGVAKTPLFCFDNTYLQQLVWKNVGRQERRGAVHAEIWSEGKEYAVSGAMSAAFVQTSFGKGSMEVAAPFVSLGVTGSRSKRQEGQADHMTSSQHSYQMHVFAKVDLVS